MAPHAFDAATAVGAAGPGRWRTDLDAGWFGSAAPHGGHLAAQLLSAMQLDAGGLAARSLTLHFVSRGVPGPLEIGTRVERAGRSLSTVSARATQEGRTVALALAALGGQRRGPELPDAPAPAIAPPGELRGPSERAQAAMPPFTRFYELRFGFGAPRGGGEPSTGGWLRPREPRAPDDLLTTALTDAWMPSVYVALEEPVRTTTVELTINFAAAAAGLPADGWYLTAFTTTSARDGYYREEGGVWGQDGRLLARCSQLGVFVEERRSVS